MTANQINYLKHLETVRHNQMEEVELNRHNTATEYETNRSNVAKEVAITDQNRETQRSNLAKERLNEQALHETQRSNLVNEDIKRFHETEAQRHNVANEQIGRSQVALGYSQLAEQKRHNTQMEEYQSWVSASQSAKNQAETYYIYEQGEGQELINDLYKFDKSAGAVANLSKAVVALGKFILE